MLIQGGTKMNKTKLNFLQQINIAVTKPMKYFQLSKVSGGRLTGFVFLFVLITSLFTMIPLLFDLIGPNGYVNLLHKDIPKFELADGQLNVAKTFKEDNNLEYILIDTNVNSFSADDVNDTYYTTILISKTNIVTSQNGRTQIIKFSDLGNLHFDNRIMNIIIPLIYLIILMAMAFGYLILVGLYFLTALLYSLVGVIVSALDHSNIKYSRIFKTAIYAKVTTSIISALLSLVPVAIPALVTRGLFILITCAYVVYGTLSHNNEEISEDSGMNPPPLQNY